MAASTQDSDDIIAGINITPLVDIVLVLLIIFIVTASMVLRHAVPVELPRAESSEEQTAGLLALAITRDGVLTIDGRPSSYDEIGGAVSEARARLGPGKAPTAIVSADIASRYGDFAKAVDRLRVAGVADIALDTRPPELGPETR